MEVSAHQVTPRGSLRWVFWYLKSVDFGLDFVTNMAILLRCLKWALLVSTLTIKLNL